MRYILFIAAFLCSSVAFGQGAWNPAATYNIWKGTKSDSIAIVPRDTIARNTALLPSTGQPVGDYGRIQAKNKLFYFHDSIRNRRVAFYDDILSIGVTPAQLHDSLSVLNLERVTTTGPSANQMTRDLTLDAAGSFGRLRFNTANGVINRVYSQTAGATQFRPIGFSTGGMVVSDLSGTIPSWDAVSSLQVNGIFTAANKIESTDGNVSAILSGVGLSGITGTLSNHSFLFYSNGAERMRLSASGRFLINTAIDDGVAVLQVNGVTAGLNATASNHYVTRGQVTDSINLRLSTVAVPTFQQVTTSGNSTDRFVRFTGVNSISGSGPGLELYTDAAPESYVQSYNRTTAAYIPLNLSGSVVKSSRLLVSAPTDDGTSALQVNGAGRFTGSVNTSDGTISNTFSYGNPSGTPGGILGTLSNHPVAFYTNGSERMRIAATGNVGIGTTTPATPLEVNGTITAPILSSPSGSDLLMLANGAPAGARGTWTTQGLGIGGNPGGTHSERLLVSGNAVATDAWILDGSGVIGEWFLDGSSGASLRTTTNHYMRLITNNVERIRLQAGGGAKYSTGVLMPQRTVSANTTLTIDDYTIFVNSNSIVLSINTGSVMTGTIYRIVNPTYTGVTSDIAIYDNGTPTTVIPAGAKWTIQHDGSKWVLISD